MVRIAKDTTRKRVAANVSRLLEARGWSQSELARRAGIPQRTIHQTATGVCMPSIAVVVAIARTLGVSVDDLIAPRQRRGNQLVESR